MTTVEKFKTLVDVPEITDFIKQAKQAISDIEALVDKHGLTEELVEPLMKCMLDHGMVFESELETQKSQ